MRSTCERVCAYLLLTRLAVLSLEAQVMPSKDTPAEKTLLTNGPGVLPPVWLSRWDNPVVQGTLTFQPDQFAKRKADAWEYYKFDLETRVQGPVNNPNQSQIENLYTWPQKGGSFSGTGSQFTWEVHGTRLAPRVNKGSFEGLKSVQPMRDDWDPAAWFLPDGAYGLFQLHPDVSLIPVHVVVLAPENNRDFPPGWYSEKDADVLLDDLWTGSKSKTTNPGESPHDVVTTWSQKVDCVSPWCKSWQPAQPDRVFDQCSIQFRKISYTMCTVPGDVFANHSTGFGCDENFQAGRVQTAVNNCLSPEKNDGIPRLIFTGSLVNTQLGCVNQVTGGQKGNDVIETAVGLMTDPGPFGIAHEFGHLLGLNHPITSEVVCKPAQLMCPYVASQTEDLAPGACKIAKQLAVKFQSKKWH